jgi:hypothetical protein
MTIIEDVFIFMSMHIDHSLKGSILQLNKCLMPSRKKKVWRAFLCMKTLFVQIDPLKDLHAKALVFQALNSRVLGFDAF